MGRVAPHNKYNIMGHHFNDILYSKDGLKPNVAFVEKRDGRWYIINSEKKDSSSHQSELLAIAHILGFTHYSVKKERGGKDYFLYPVRIQKSIRGIYGGEVKI